MSPTTPPLIRVRTVVSDEGRRAFELARLEASIARALRAGGEPVEPAGQLAQVVVAALHEDDVARDELAQLVERVLSCAGAARAGALYREERERRRCARARLVLVREGARGADAHPWSRAALARWLEHEAALGRDDACAIADEVERGVLASGLVRVSESLLREWVDDVLAQRGDRPRLGARARWGASEPLLGPATRGHAGAAAERRLLEAALPACARAERFSPALREAHASGALYVEGLEHPTRWLRLAAPAGTAAEAIGSAGSNGAANPCAWHDLVAESVAVVHDGEGAALDALADAWCAGASGALPLVVHARAPGAIDAALARLERDPGAPLALAVPLRAVLDADDPRARALLRREQVDARVLLVRDGAPVRPVRRRIALGLPRLVLEHGATEAALDRAEALARLAAAALVDWTHACEGLDAAVAREAGPAARGATDELGLVGIVQAEALARAALGPEPARAWTLALARRLRAVAAENEPPLVLAYGSRAAAAALGRLDRRAHPHGRAVLDVARDRARYRYLTSLPAGAEPGDWAVRLAAFGLRDEAVPRSAGSLDERLALLRALRVPAPESPCA